MASTLNEHIVTSYEDELTNLNKAISEMGGMVERQVADAINAVMNADGGLAERVLKGDAAINHMEVSIDEECALILARRHPAAGDLRLVLAISRALHDLERMGDEATKIAEHAIRLIDHGEMPRWMRSSKRPHRAKESILCSSTP